LNVVDEMAIASGQPVPRVFVLPREDAINAFVAGWGAQDLALCVTRGALERLNRAELQGLVAHEFGHIEKDDLPLTMRLLALVWGLSLVHGYGRNLMASDDAGRVNPLAWLLGVVFAIVGWMGWLAGRVLQAAVSREREHLADACAIQYTRTRDGLGNVLRKIWHDQQVLAGRMRHPASDMIASLLLQESGHVSWLASHPPIESRILRICGSVLSPLPAPLLRLDAVEPRHAATSPGALLAAGATLPMGAGQARADRSVGGSTAQASSQAGRQEQQARQERQQADREARQRLQGRVGPTEERLIVLALMMNLENPREVKLWRKVGEGVHQPEQILQDVAKLQPKRRVTEFERLTASIAQSPLPQRRALVEQARDLLRADGRVSPRDRLWWLALRHRMGMHQRSGQAFMRPVTGQGQDLSSLSPSDLHHVRTMSTYLARFIPAEQTQSGLPSANRAWLEAVNRRLNADWTSQTEDPAVGTDADALAHALAGLQELSWVLRPQLVKAWVEEAMNHSPQGLMSHETADALRLMAGLLDAPMPPMLEAHYKGD
ncbi:M48 family metalloprotease, partial [Aquabacterium sp. UBA2148]|uniref:M48 family metalloprotease n=1 Tax=Aquabacterium sp. UBA2148 TaxID=1946042 RepID=UPI00257F32CD